MDLRTRYTGGERSSVGRPSAEAMVNLRQRYGITDGDFSKALTIDGALGNSVTSMVGESLDPIVRYITLNSQNFLAFLRRLRTYRAFAHVEQINIVDSLGKGRWGGSGHNEGELGTEDNAAYRRATEDQREFGQVGIVSTKAQLASQKKFGDLKAREAYHRLQKLLLDIEHTIIHGDSTKNPYVFDGLYKRQNDISSNPNIVEMVTTGTTGSSRETYVSGRSLDLGEIRPRFKDGLTYGKIPNAFYLSPEDKLALADTQNSNLRFHKGDSRVELGITVDQLDNPLGDPIDCVWSVFMTNGGHLSAKLTKDPTLRNTATDPFHEDAPLPPASIGTITVGAGGKLVEGTTYYYAVCYVNEKAEGPILGKTTGIATTNANGLVTIPVTHPADVADSHSMWLFRSTVAPSSSQDISNNWYFVKEVAVSGAAGAVQNIEDDGSILINSRIAMLLPEDQIALPELQEPSYRDLADTTNAHRFSIDAIMSPMLYDEAKSHTLFRGMGGSCVNPS